MMIRIAVLYPQQNDSHFDLAYYLNKHIPLVKERLNLTGLIRVEVDEGIGTNAPDQPAPYVAIGYLIFERIEDFQRGFSAHGAELIADIPNYTNIQPQIQISRIVAES
jgi:uncharacterized protein (TIGR02118 family)